MNDSRTTVENLMRGRKAGRVGIYDVHWGQTLAKWLDQGYPKNAEGKPVDPVEHFGFDMAGAGGWFDILPLRGHTEILQESDEWVIRRNGAGAALKWWKTKAGTPEHMDFRMTSREVWERDYRPHLLALDPARVDIEGTKKALANRRAAGRWAFMGHLFVWENMRQSMGDVCLYESLLLDPDWIHDYCRVHTDFFQRHYRHIFEQAGLPDGIWMYEDLGYKNALFCNPSVLERLIFPYYREMVDFFHSYNLPVVLHSCGFVEPALDLIVQAGFDALNPMEAKAGNDLLRIARRYGDKLAFVGGLDARVLESHDHALIRREVTRLIDGMKAIGARYIFGSDHSISTNVDYADFKLAVDVYRDHMGC